MGVDPVTGAAVIGGASTLIGQYMQSQAAGDANKPAPTVPNPYYDAIMTRAMGILDKYMQSRGITPTVGINPGQNPDALGSTGPELPSDGGWLNGGPMQSPPKPPRPDASGQPRAINGEGEGPRGIPNVQLPDNRLSAEPPKEDDGFTNAAMAAEIGARRMGITQDAPMFQTTREFYEQDQERKKAELKKLNEYIYGQRSIGV